MLSGKIDLPFKVTITEMEFGWGKSSFKPKVELKGQFFIGDDVIIDKDVFIDSYSVIGIIVKL